MQVRDLIGFNPEVFVQEFIDAFEAKGAPWPKLVEEEIDEFYEAWGIVMDTPDNVDGDTAIRLSADLLKEFCDILYVLAGLKLCDPGHQLPMKQVCLLKMAADAAHDVFGKELIAEAFVEVHDSNMSKLGADGKPFRREDGKVLKGPNYRPANIVGILLPQSKAIN